MKVGESLEKVFLVRQEHSAIAVGSGSVNVLSTPMMIAFMENVALELVQKYLEKGKTTVGYHVDVKHLIPISIGKEVKVRATLIEVNGKKLKFKVEAFYEDKKIGEGLHERSIVEESEFMKRVL
ncbi:MAG: thioesterase family protein [Saccharolobus sp.]|uniref:thioesterase family protein n=1 Tax=Sulfolobaceae TaxID=118883 RepID=UPI001F06E409|nr:MULTISPECIES: thioesterase family protein [Sulfolobaceae]MCH1772282.1 thioesterase family protein [Metallosphaera sedula]MCH4816813.1 thioesterase family protein [Saccharolobus shibatae]